MINFYEPNYYTTEAINDEIGRERQTERQKHRERERDRQTDRQTLEREREREFKRLHCVYKETKFKTIMENMCIRNPSL